MTASTALLFVTGRAFQLASATFISCAAATLSLDSLRANVRERWQSFNGTEDDVVSGFNDWEADIFNEVARPGAAVLIAGCGSGRDVLPYLNRGCTVTGLDPASHALALAKRVIAAHGYDITLIDGFIDDTVVPGRFDAVVFSWGCYNAIPESRRRVATLRRLAEQLNPGGRISLNFDRLLRPRPIVARAARIAGALARSDWRVEPGDVIEWRRQIDVPVFTYSHAFTPEEVGREVAAAGLRIVRRQDPPAFPFVILEASS